MKNIVDGHLTGFGDVQDFEESPTVPAAAQFDSQQAFEDYYFDKTYSEIVKRENEERAKKENKGRKVATKRTRKIIKTTWRTR